MPVDNVMLASDATLKNRIYAASCMALNDEIREIPWAESVAWMAVNDRVWNEVGRATYLPMKELRIE
jgi:hypothetical protein